MAADQRRSLSSLFSARRKSHTRAPPTLVVSDDPAADSALSDGKSLFSSGLASSGNGSVLDSPTQTRPEGLPGRTPSKEEKEKERPNRWKTFRKKALSKRTRKAVVGMFVSVLIAISWVGSTQFIKMTYYGSDVPELPNSTNAILRALHQGGKYSAPFLTTWFCTAWTTLFFPIFTLLQCARCRRKEQQPAPSQVVEAVRYFRDRGFTIGQFVGRTVLFCLLWVGTNYLYIRSLRVLVSTDVMALFSTNVAFAYLLSWVVLHQQFVGVRIVAVILCSTGIALLAYMDGVAQTPTLGSVVMAAAGSAGSAVYKVFFRKCMGECGLGPVSLFLSLISIVSTLLLWPLVLGLTLAGVEVVVWNHLPWIELCCAAGLTLVCNLLSNFGALVTYEVFVTVGLILAVPLSSAVDVRWYNASFEGMRLTGVILIICGFLLVLFPGDWPNYLGTIVRWGKSHHPGHHATQPPGPEPVDYRTGIISRSRLRSSGGQVR